MAYDDSNHFIIFYGQYLVGSSSSKFLMQLLSDGDARAGGETRGAGGWRVSLCGLRASPRVSAPVLPGLPVSTVVLGNRTAYLGAQGSKMPGRWRSTLEVTEHITSAVPVG